jgi:hypothetical protein
MFAVQIVPVSGEEPLMTQMQTVLDEGNHVELVLGLAGVALDFVLH